MSDEINIPRIDGTAGRSGINTPNPIGATLGDPETKKNVETALGNHLTNIGNALVDALQNIGPTSPEQQELLERNSVGARQQQ